MKLTSSSCFRHVSLWSGWLQRPSSIECTPHRVMFGPLGFFSGRSSLWVSLITHNTRYIIITVYLQYHLFYLLQGPLPIRVFASTSYSAGGWRKAPGWDLQSTPPLRCEWTRCNWSHDRNVGRWNVLPWSNLLALIDTRPCWTAGWIVPQTGQLSQSWSNIWATYCRPAHNRSVWKTTRTTQLCQ